MVRARGAGWEEVVRQASLNLSGTQKAGFAAGGSLAWVLHEGLWCQPCDSTDFFLLEPTGFI